MGDSIIYVNAILALAFILIPLAGLYHRNKSDKGIGWQFIRFNVIALSLPATALLALNGMLSEGAIAIISASLGFAFGKKDA